MSTEVVDDYRDILTNHLPVIDVRSPDEYAKGSIPSATNLPILNDDERRKVGTCYKNQGSSAAIELGQKLVDGGSRAQRVQDWAAFARSHHGALLCCWRGGLRSRIAQEWLAAEIGSLIPVVKGGSKALRSYCLQQIEASANHNWLVLGGRTGSGKTQLLNQLSNAIDLEQLANHRGSAFGGEIALQPPPISFENAVAAALLSADQNRPIVVEDESRTIGRLSVPGVLFESMQRAPLVILELSLERRVANIYNEYVVNGIPSSFTNALGRIHKRLGGARYDEILKLMEDGFHARKKEPHSRWIELLLTNYYDPMYDYQLEQKKARVIFRGPADDVGEYLSEGIINR